MAACFVALFHVIADPASSTNEGLLTEPCEARHITERFSYNRLCAHGTVSELVVSSRTKVQDGTIRGRSS
jgi:hypothetical protein